MAWPIRNTLGAGAVLVALILTVGPISGAHFNPAVTLADAAQGRLTGSRKPDWRGEVSVAPPRRYSFVS
jgi:glycerol uptake facilitator-like aquaporin